MKKKTKENNDDKKPGGFPHCMELLTHFSKSS